jgi:hypothetical protein
MFKGEYKRIKTNGSLNVYSPGDSVSYQGKIYLFNKTSEYSPSEDPEAWIFTGETLPFSSTVPPLNPIPNQMWLNTNTATTYIYMYDGSSYQWVST